MGFKQNAYAKIWELEDKGKYHVVNMCTSKKNNETGSYETDWSNKFVRFVGKAHNQAKQLQEGAKVQILGCEVTNNYDKEKKITYTNYVVFELAEGESGQQTRPTPNAATIPTDSDGFMSVDDGMDNEDLPFN